MQLADISYFMYIVMPVTAALAQYGTVSTPYIGRAQESPDEFGSYVCEKLLLNQILLKTLCVHFCMIK